MFLQPEPGYDATRDCAPATVYLRSQGHFASVPTLTGRPFDKNDWSRPGS
jgi:hypothetical protein